MRFIKPIKTNRDGAAMVMAICVAAVITALSLALLLTCAVIMNSIQQEKDREQSRILAVSLSEEIEKQLTQVDYEGLASDGSLWFYIRDEIKSGNWPYFNEDERGHTARYANKELTLKPESIPASIIAEYPDVVDTTIVMFWESSLASSDTADFTEIPLTVKVTCKYGTSICTISSEYSLDWLPPASNGGVEQWIWSLTWRQ